MDQVEGAQTAPATAPQSTKAATTSVRREKPRACARRCHHLSITTHSAIAATMRTVIGDFSNGNR